MDFKRKLGFLPTPSMPPVNVPLPVAPPVSAPLLAEPAPAASVPAGPSIIDQLRAKMAEILERPAYSVPPRPPADPTETLLPFVREETAAGPIYRRHSVLPPSHHVGRIPVDAAQPNPFGLLHMHGNVREWTEDCWNASLTGLPRDGSARTSGDCKSHVVRGGAWSDEPKDLRSAKRGWEIATERRAQLGFRVARVCRNADAVASGRCD